MRFYRPVTTAAAVLTCALAMMVGVRCETPSEVAADVLRAAMADDVNWYHILRQKIKLSRESFGPHAAEMLDALNVKDSEPFATHLVVGQLAQDEGATGSQLAFGLRALGTAVSCQFVNTLMVHTYFVKLYGDRGHVKTQSVRWCVSKVQMGVVGYVDKLAAFDGQPLDFYVRLNNTANELHARHEADDQLDKAEFMDALNRVLDDAKQVLADRCGVTDEQEIVKTLQVNSYNDSIFTVTDSVEDQQLLAMIKSLDPYEYVRANSLGVPEWTRRLGVVEYKLPVDLATIIDTADDSKE